MKGMDEIYAMQTWDKLPMPQRAALLAALPSGNGATDKKWNQLSRESQKLLLALDWNFMLGGKLGLS